MARQHSDISTYRIVSTLRAMLKGRRFVFGSAILLLLSVSLAFVSSSTGAVLFFASFLLVGAYTIYLFIDLEERISPREWSRYYELAERLLYVIIMLYFLIFMIALEKFWRVFVVKSSLNPVFLSAEAFLSLFIFLICIEYVAEQYVFVEKYFFQGEEHHRTFTL